MKNYHRPHVLGFSLLRAATLAALIFGLSSASYAESTGSTKESIDASRNKVVLDAKYRAKINKGDFMIVQYVITQAGNVKKPQVIASTNAKLKSRVLSEIQKWRFKGSDREATVRQRIEFR